MKLKISRALAIKLVIGSFIFLFHLLFFFYPQFESKSQLPYKKGISVHTYIQAKQKKTLEIIPISSSSHQKRKKSKLKQIPQKKENSTQHIEILKKMFGKLDKLSSSPLKKSKLSLPPKIEALSIDEGLPKGSSSYQILLSDFLKANLKLPEKGMTKAKVTILQNGDVEKVEILYTQSILNNSYLEKHLLKISLPPFPKELLGNEKQTFIFLFCHES